MIDWDRVSELREDVGAEDFGEVVEIFLEEVDDALQCLGDGSAALHEQLHFLKGSALNLGFADFAEMCRLGEESAASDPTAVDLERLRSCYTRSRSTFLNGLEARFAA